MTLCIISDDYPVLYYYYYYYGQRLRSRSSQAGIHYFISPEKIEEKKSLFLCIIVRLLPFSSVSSLSPLLHTSPNSLSSSFLLLLFVVLARHPRRRSSSSSTFLFFVSASRPFIPTDRIQSLSFAGHHAFLEYLPRASIIIIIFEIDSLPVRSCERVFFFFFFFFFFFNPLSTLPHWINPSDCACTYTYTYVTKGNGKRKSSSCLSVHRLEWRPRDDCSAFAPSLVEGWQK